MEKLQKMENPEKEEYALPNHKWKNPKKWGTQKK